MSPSRTTSGRTEATTSRGHKPTGFSFLEVNNHAYIHFTEEQKRLAASVDLVEFLRQRGEKLLPSGHEKRLDSDHSITVRGNEWYDHAA